MAFEMLPSNHMLVEARINDKGPYHLIFDLGAPVTLLNNRASESSGVVKPDSSRSILFGMRGEAQVNRLKVGDLTAEKLPVIVLDHPVLTLSKTQPAQDRRHHRIHVFCPIQDHHRLPCPPDDVRADLVPGARRAQGASRAFARPQGRPAQVAAPSGLWGLQLGRSSRRARGPGRANQAGSRRISR